MKLTVRWRHDRLNGLWLVREAPEGFETVAADELAHLRVGEQALEARLLGFRDRFVSDLEAADKASWKKVAAWSRARPAWPW